VELETISSIWLRNKHQQKPADFGPRIFKVDPHIVAPKESSEPHTSEMLEEDREIATGSLDGCGA